MEPLTVVLKRNCLKRNCLKRNCKKMSLDLETFLPLVKIRLRERYLSIMMTV